jgi:hypothetical protein
VGNYLLTPDSGVAQKSFALADAMRNTGIEVHCVAFPTYRADQYKPNAAVEVIFAEENKNYNAVTEYFKTKIRRDDVVLFRYPLASKHLLALVKEFGSQIIFEHNTIEAAEVLMLQKTHLSRLPVSWRPSYLRYAFQTKVLRQTDETRFGPEVLRHALGGICVSQEIAHYETNRCHSYHTCVVANGVKSQALPNSRTLPFANTLRVCMIIGSPAVWHGYERMFEGLKQYVAPGCAISIDMIGMQKPDNLKGQSFGRHDVNWLGVMKREDVARHLDNCHLAVGTLALFRKEMKEASPLKVRECLMLGLPMILGYEDTDVSADPRFNDYILQVPNTNEPINWSRVVDFYRRLSANQHHRKEIAALAGEVLSMQKKAERYLAFMKTRFEASMAN